MVDYITFFHLSPDMSQEIDTVTQRPRTPNDQYTCLTDEQIKNIKKVEAYNTYVHFLYPTMFSISDLKRVPTPSSIQLVAREVAQHQQIHPQKWGVDIIETDIVILT